MGVNSISESVPSLSSPLDSADLVSQEVQEVTRRARVDAMLATLDAMNAEVEERVRRGEVTWQEIEEFVESLDRQDTQHR